ncbi:MAG TPA: hypothetical protein V6D14_24750 [Coleofasciculaceae cyanobacterium]|jgi:hypothetical protein
MVNYGINVGSLLGIVDVILAIAYLAISIALAIVRRRDLGVTGVALYIVQTIFAPLILLVSGFVLFFQGWRLDPTLLFAFLLLHLLLIYLGITDVNLLRLVSSRNQGLITLVILLLSSLIVILQRWRLDPLLLFAYLLLGFLIVYLVIKNFILFRLISRRNRQ